MSTVAVAPPSRITGDWAIWAFLIAVISFVPGANGLAHLGGVVLGAAWGATLRTPAHAAWTPCGILLGVTWLAAFAAVTLQ